MTWLRWRWASHMDVTEFKPSAVGYSRRRVLSLDLENAFNQVDGSFLREIRRNSGGLVVGEVSGWGGTVVEVF